MPAGNAILISLLALVLTISISYNPSVVFATFAGFGILILATCIVWLLYHPTYMPEFLVAVAYLSLLGLKMSVGGLNLRPNMLVAFVALVWAFRNKKRIPAFPWFVAVNVTYLGSTLLNYRSLYFARGIADCFLLTVNLVQYGIVTQSQNFNRLLRTLFLASSSAYSGLVLLYLVMAAGFIPGLERPEGEFVRLALLDPTPASYILFTLLALLCYLFLFGYPFSKALTFWCLAAHFAALAFSYSRAAWLSSVFVFLCFWLFCIVRFPLRRTLLGTVILALTLVPIAGGAYWYLSGGIGQMLVDRAQAVSLEEGTVVNRLILWANMIDDWRSAPILGHGAHNYGKFVDGPADISENYTLELLHSGGLLTAGMFVFGLAVLLFKAMPWNWQEALDRPWSLPIATGFLGMSLSALANPAMEGGVYWVGAGFLALVAKNTTEYLNA
jgi:O-antigen ligase/polysaccharide polymerase Wzy-like membrane protein